MSSKKFPVTNLDFDEIKSGLIDYMKSQDQFKDYDFKGSNMSVLMDLLSYNTFQNNFYNNMAISEMFLDSAQLRDSVVSHAKELNYLPKSRVSSRAVVDVILNTVGNPAFVLIPAKTKFTAVCGSKTYNFFTKETVTVEPLNGEYRYNNLDIFEGRYVTELFEPGSTPGKRYLISNSNVDINSIEVNVIENDFKEEYQYASDLYNLSSESKSFFLQPHVGDKYELFFGKDRFGIEPKAGSVIEVTYRVSSGDQANGITSFEVANDIAGFSSNVSLRVASRGGAERESLESIKYFAPKSIQVQERAITSKDFEVLLKMKFPEIRTVAAYGGEILNPPQYGRVIVSIALEDFSNISFNSRERYREYLKERCSLTIEPVVVPAEFIYFDVETIVKFDASKTNQSKSDIQALIQSSILDYSDNNLGDFKKTLRLSKLSALIDNTLDSILSNETDIKMILEIEPVPNIPDNFVLNFGNKLFVQRDQTVLNDPIENANTAIVSSAFVFNGINSYLRDNGKGNLDIVQNTGSEIKYISRNVGTVNYETGVVTIDGFILDSYTGSSVKFYAKTASDDIVTPIDHVSLIRSGDIKITIESGK